MKKDIIHLDTTASTNDVLKQCDTPAPKSMMVVVADFQTRGRGQADNKWESQRGKNLLMSILTGQTDIPADRQFVLSMAGALALKEALNHYTTDISLKWPNDIYWHNGKISGTLIETSLSGKTIKRCIYGIGLNINQQRFYSDAPNPVSLWQILGREVPIDEMMGRVLCAFDHFYTLATSGAESTIVEQYNKALFWNDNEPHTFEDVASHARFRARIKEVAHDGLLRLITEEGNERAYTLKEVKFCI